MTSSATIIPHHDAYFNSAMTSAAIIFKIDSAAGFLTTFKHSTHGRWWGGWDERTCPPNFLKGQGQGIICSPPQIFE